MNYSTFVIGTLILYLVIMKIKYPLMKISCMIGIHDYWISSGTKHGMYFEEGGRGLVGTARQLWRCDCGKYKPAKDEDVKIT